MNAMALTLLTPIRTLHFEDGDLVVLMTKQGSEGFLYNHVPTLVEVVPGALRYRVPDPFGGEDTWRIFFVSVGYAEIQCDHVTVVVNAAELPGEIDEKRAMSALKRAEDRLKKLNLTKLEQEHAEHGVRRAKARLAFHRRYCSNETAQ